MAFAYYKSATLDHTQVGSSDSANWPLTIGLGVGPQSADTDLKTVANGGYVQNSSGYDIRPYADSALTTPLTYELVYYDGVNGKLEMHVQIPTLTHSSDAVIYLAFGDATISTDGSSTATWNANYKGIWHLGNGSTLSLKDSTSNSNNGTNNGMGAGAGNIDGGATGDGATKYADMGNNASLYPSTVVTLSAWIFPTSAAQNGAVAGAWDTGANTDNSALLYIGQDSTTATMSFGVEQSNNTTVFLAPANTFTANTWIYLVGVADGSNLHLYINGVDCGTTKPYNGTLQTTASHFWISQIAASGGIYRFAGTIDEVRISNTNRSADWITAEYNAQKASSTFITWSSKTSTTSLSPLQLAHRLTW